MQITLKSLAAEIVAIERDIARSQDRCFDLESDINDLQGDLAAEEAFQLNLQDELENLLATQETIDPLVEIIEKSYDTNIIVSDIADNLDKEGRKAYVLTLDKHEIERAGGEHYQDIGFAFIHYKGHIPVIAWGGQGIPYPDAPLKLLCFRGENHPMRC